MRHRLLLGPALGIGLLLLTPRIAAADGLLTLFGGVSPFTFSGDAGSHSNTSVSYGGSLTFKGTFGVDIDFGLSDHITGVQDAHSDNARSFVANVIVDVGPKRGRLQPYASGGGGFL